MSEEDEASGGLAAQQFLLKNGQAHSALESYVCWRVLVGIQTSRRRHLLPLLAIAEGNQGSIPNETRKQLAQQYPQLFDSLNELKPLVRDVIISAVSQTSEGIVVDFPYQTRDEQDVALFDAIEKHEQRFSQRILRTDELPPSPILR